jgi:hypothetical protein
MYTDAVFYAGSWADPDYARSHGSRDDSAGRVKLFGQWVYDGHGPDGYAYRVVAVWSVAIGGTLAGLGAAAGAGVGWALRRRLRQFGRTDPVLGLLTSGAVTAGLVAAGIPWENENGMSLWRWTRQVLGRPGVPEVWELLSLGKEGLRLVVLALPVGWAVHVVAAGFGVRLSARSEPEQAADYDDAKTAPTRAAGEPVGTG